jgi:hypothetical protein
MQRVDNSGSGVMANMRTTTGYWENVTIIDSKDSNIEIIHDFILLWVGYGSDFEVRNGYYRNPEFAALSMAATNDGRLTIKDSVFVDNNALRLVDTYLEGCISLYNVTLVRTNVQYMQNCILSTPCLRVSNLHIEDPVHISYIAYINEGEAYLSDTKIANLSMDLFHIFTGSAHISNVTIEDSNTAIVVGGYDCTITARELVMQRCTNSALLQISQSTATLTGLKLKDMKFNQLFVLQNTKIRIFDMELERCDVDSYGGLATVQGNSQFYLTNSNITHINGSLSVLYGLFHVENSQFAIISCIFNAFNATLVYSSKSALEFEGSSFQNGGFLLANSAVYLGKTYGGVLNDQNSLSIRIFSCQFANLSAQFGGVLSLSQAKEGEITYKFEYNQAFNCSAQYGGVIYASKVSLIVTNSNFTYNHADYGGAVWTSGVISSSELIITHSSFISNAAAVAGGAIHYISCEMLAQSLLFLANSAIYGENISAGLKYMAVINENTHLPEVNYTLEAASGQSLTKQLRIGLFDELNQLIVTDNSSQMTLSTGTEGEILLYPSNGVYTADNIVVFGTIQTTISLIATARGVSSPAARVYLRECAIGEYFNASKCLLCSNNMYSLAPIMPCSLCPREAVCTEGYKLALLPGYWRSSIYTDNIYPCLVPQLCLGGFEGKCMPGHRGSMCNDCEEDYFKVNQLQCAACKGIGTSSVKSVLALTVSMVSVVVSMRDRQRFQMIHSAVFSYFNTIRILANLNLYWPESLAYLVTVIGDIGSLGLTAFSDLCLGSLSSVQSVYSQVFISVIYFLCIGIATALVSFTVFCFKQRPFQYAKISQFILFTCYQMLPMLFMRMTQLLSCYEVDSVQRLVYDPSEECWTGRHRQYVFGVALPVMLGALSVPCALLVSTIGRRHHYSVIHMAIYLLFHFALCGVLVLSNALRFPSQVALVVLLSIATELVLNITTGYRTQWFGFVHQTTQTAATLLAISAAVYSNSSSGNRYESLFITISYAILSFPLVAITGKAVWRRASRKRVNTVSEDVRVMPAMQSIAEDSGISNAQLKVPSHTPASSVQQSFVEKSIH